MGLLTGMLGLVMGAGGSDEGSGSKRRRVAYRAYCRMCGTSGDLSRDSKSIAIKNLQMKYSGCGQNCHDPVVEEIDD